MKGKLVVIILLLLLLAVTVSQMVRFMDRPVLRSIGETVGGPARRIFSKPPSSIPDLTGTEWSDLAGKITRFTRVNGDRIEIRVAGKSSDLTPGEERWEPIFLKGFNLGAALPGKFPAEFSATREQYYRWLEEMSDLGANVVRIYTILPPEFYDALARYNFNNANRPVYLLQGVWAYVIEEGSYGDSSYIANFHAEIRDAVDVVHGNAVLEPRPGHASGEYASDVSRYTLAFLLGREWEPNTVSDMRRQFPERTSYEGVFFSVPKGEAMECWLAEDLDYTAKYETAVYRFQHALSFVNWLPLDPMYHDSEWIEWDQVREYDNDLESINPALIQDSPLFRAGYFASYHAYPYYPDFVYNDRKYRAAADSRGPCTYYGYLEDLVQAHKGMPVVIAEFGVPSSRSAAHFEPDGMNQGGHSEVLQGEYNARMIRDISEAGGAGAVLFAWIDEWFKHNWLVMDFEKPKERNKLWHNLEDPEQNFGIVAMESKKIQIDGDFSDWPASSLLADDPSGDATGNGADIRALWAVSDASCVYFRIDLREAVDWSSGAENTLWLGIDTYDRERGDNFFPGKALRAPSGLEFVVEIGGPGKSRVLVDAPYDIFTDYFRNEVPGYASLPNNDGIYHEQRLLANRMRETLYGEQVPEILLTRSNLRWATADSSAPEHDTRADIFAGPDGRSIELRIPWALLNVTDPSSRSVLDNRPDTPEIDISETDGFMLYLASLSGGDGRETAADLLPDNFDGKVVFRWDGWEEPEYTERLKEGADLVAEAFREITGYARPAVEREQETSAIISPWPDGKAEGVTVTFDDGSSYQYRYGKKLLEKYRMRGTFFIVTGWTGHSPLITGEPEGLITRRLSIPEVIEMNRAGHEIGSHGHEHRSIRDENDEQWLRTTFAESQELISSWTGKPAVSLSYPYSSMTPESERILSRIGFRYGRVGGDIANDPALQDPMRLFSFVIVDDNNPDPETFVKIFDSNRRKWTILQYHHLFPEDAREYSQLVSHNVEEKYNVVPRNFEREMRLLRNRDLAVGTMQEIGDYLETRRATSLEFTQHQQSIIITLTSDSSAKKVRRPLTIEVTSPWEWLHVEGSRNDGIYHNRTGTILFDADPGTEIAVHNETPDDKSP